jgi:type III restriction enzyme
VVTAIKRGLEEDGLGDLVHEVRTPEAEDNGKGPRQLPRRPGLTGSQIYLPKVLRVEDGRVRELDYEQDVLFALNWGWTRPPGGEDPWGFNSAERQAPHPPKMGRRT